MKKSIKEYTKFVSEKLGNPDIDEHQIDELMKSYGFKYNEEFK